MKEGACFFVCFLASGMRSAQKAPGAAARCQGSFPIALKLFVNRKPVSDRFPCEGAMRLREIMTGGRGKSELGAKGCPSWALFGVISNRHFGNREVACFLSPAIQGPHGEERGLVRRWLPAAFDRLLLVAC